MLREMIAFASEQLMEIEVGTTCRRLAVSEIWQRMDKSMVSQIRLRFSVRFPYGAGFRRDRHSKSLI
ncbi:MAG: hypothetical protein FJX47_14275 [Alphaproteobacteria bacterium]|nr:hypothetical protein [Alphaproteobacteria bacterium]